MKTILHNLVLAAAVILFFGACSNTSNEPAAASPDAVAAVSSEQSSGGQMDVKDDESQANVVKVAVGSKDHTTLVKAVQAADLVNALSNNGPFTVFAPTNAAFDALPAGTVEGLLKPEKKDALADILQYHVFIGVLGTDQFHDGQSIEMVNSGMATLHAKDGKYMINDANIIASVPAANGVVHVIDKVILPPSK